MRQPERDWTFVTASCVLVVVAFGFAIAIWAGANFSPVRIDLPATVDPYLPDLSELESSHASYESICAFPKTYDQADLCQQWRTANASERAAASADAQVVIGVLGLAALLFTVVYAARAVTVSRETGEAQVRAYLMCKRATFRIAEQWIWVELHLKNYGQSPAVNVIASGILETAEFLYYPVQLKDAIISPQKEGRVSVLPTGDIESGATIGWSANDGTTEQREAVQAAINALADGNNNFSVRCRLEWQDVFGRNHHHNFMLWYDKDGGDIDASLSRRDGTIDRVVVMRQDDATWPSFPNK